MKLFLLFTGIIFSVFVIFGVYRLIKLRRQRKRLDEERFERVKTLYNKLENGEIVTKEEVYPYAEDVCTREIVFQLLEGHNKAEIFPVEFNTIVKAAESNLVNWLEFPTELDTCPDEIEHIKRVTFSFDVQKSFVHYEVFKYRTFEPHWAAKNGWALGVVGPYFDDSQPYDFPQATFSRISSTLDKISPDEEAKWVHENILMRGQT